MSSLSGYVTHCCNMSHIVAIRRIAAHMLPITAICYVAVNMSNWGKICSYKMKKVFWKNGTP